MAVVARTRQRDHVLTGAGTLMTCCLEAGLPVASACSGQGACGKCMLTILRGAQGLPPAQPHEAAVLARNNALTGQRLGCQCLMPGTEVDLLLTTGYW
jgi:ferredoxin